MRHEQLAELQKRKKRTLPTFHGSESLLRAQYQAPEQARHRKHRRCIRGRSQIAGQGRKCAPSTYMIEGATGSGPPRRPGRCPAPVQCGCRAGALMRPSASDLPAQETRRDGLTLNIGGIRQGLCMHSTLLSAAAAGRGA